MYLPFIRKYYVQFYQLINYFAKNLQSEMSELHNNLHQTPQKPSKLFQSFSDFTKDSIQKPTHASSSGQIQYSASELLNYISPFSPFLEASHPDQNRQNQRFSVTDRYIPSRKLLKKDSLFSDFDENCQNQNDGIKPETNSLMISDLYKKYIMSDQNKQSKERLIETYQNNNILKYTHKSISSSSQPPLLTKNSSLQFTDELSSNTVKKRKINKLPCKVLDAPALQDDYYLNLIDWSTQNYLAVGLASSVYLWNANNSKVTKLCDLGISDSATSVSWSLKGPNFALGTNSGEIQIWDVNKMKKLRILHGHTNRVGAISWNSTILSTGSRDKTILHRDLRSSSPFFSKLVGHKQQICGLKWSFDEQQLCSGGNDNKLLVWNTHSTEPILKYTDHTAAVKAMAWSPHQHGLLVSGGGTADRTIRFRNTLSGTTIKTIDVGSQVCNLMFSKSLNQIVSTHGYSHNEINIWKYPKMEKISTLTGHTYRVLYLAMSPDGSTIVTGAGDQTLRFWNIFPNRNQSGKKVTSILNIDNVMLR